MRPLCCANIRIPQNVSLKHAIYIAVNHELAGIFAVNYNVNPAIKKALDKLINNGLNPVLAIRDFNITPSMIESKFNISSDTADYPPIEDRLALSNPDRIYTSRPLAAIGREGLNHYTECVVCARNLRKSTRAYCDNACKRCDRDASDVLSDVYFCPGSGFAVQSAALYGLLVHTEPDSRELGKDVVSKKLRKQRSSASKKALPILGKSFFSADQTGEIAEESYRTVKTLPCLADVIW